MAAIDVKCGFDPKFFALLKASFEQKTDLQKHGVLLVDEIGVRKSLNVKSGTLTYQGLVDLGDEQLNEDCRLEHNLFDKPHKKKTDKPKTPEMEMFADHGLVIMFQPLFDSSSQPIAVFASRGPTPGAVLSQLLIQGNT